MYMTQGSGGLGLGMYLLEMKKSKAMEGVETNGVWGATAYAYNGGRENNFVT